MWRVVALAGALAGGCAAPSRHLTTRQVDDPMVHPRGLASFTAAVTGTRFSPAARSVWAVLPAFRWGLTDRLELSSLSLRYAFLDDAPAPEGAPPDGRRRGPLALALQAGIEGIGWSSLEGFIVIPVVELSARKHLGGRAYLWGTLDWRGVWIGQPLALDGRHYTSTLWPTGRNSRFGIEGGALVQVVNHLAVSAGVGVHQLYGCFAPTCDWASRGVIVFGGPTFRPWRWMDLGVFGAYGTRERADGLVIPSPDPSVTPMPLVRVSWLALTVAATVRW